MNPKPEYQIISRGKAAGTYQAFPDVCRLKNNDLLCVFYAGYGHVSLPNSEYPRGGRICMVRSSDEGKTWSQPEVLYDGPQDDRDPHIAQLRDGRLVCSFFSYWKTSDGVSFDTQIVWSKDGGRTWNDAVTVAKRYACSAPVREFEKGHYLLGIYTEGTNGTWAAIARASKLDGWGAPILISQNSSLPDGTETDMIRLRDGRLLVVIRSDKVNMHYCTSEDGGSRWSAVRDIGFKGHAPHLTRLSTGEILFSHRLPNTALHVSRDEGRTWDGPHVIDDVIGAYPSTVELKDGSVLIVYYEEGSSSAVRARRFRVTKTGIEMV